MSLFLATLLVINLPLGPGSESIATRLVAPHEHAEPIASGPWHLWDIRVQPRAVIYAIGKPHEPPAVTVNVDLEAAAGGDSDAVTLTPSPNASEDATAAAEHVAKTIRARLASGTIRFDKQAPAPRDSPVDVAPPSEEAGAPRAPPAGTPRWLAVFLLLALCTSLVTCRRCIYRDITRVSPRGWWLGLALSAVTAALLATMNDVVLHPNAHGWDTVRAVAGHSATPFPLWDRYGALLLEMGRLLGFFADPGRETFVAARIAAAGSVLLLYGLTLTVLRSQAAALVAAGILATSPALLFVGRGEALSSSGLLLLLLTAWLMAMAARQRDVRLLAAGATALACLASFRLMGPIMAPCAALFALLPADERAVHSSTRRWRLMVAASWAVAALVAGPHLLRMGWLMSAELGVRPQADVIPRTLLDSPMWTPFALLMMGGAGLITLALRRHLMTALLALWLACSLLAPASSAAFYQDQARYQVYAVPALALAASAAVTAIAAWRPMVARTVLSVWLLWFAVGQSLAGEALATEQAEVVQLNTWRALPALLPPDAWLAVPVKTDGRARTSLPDVEFMAARPDVRLVSLQEAARSGDAPLFWFEGLACAARYPSEPPDVARDCVSARRHGVLEPVFLVSVDPELPDELAGRVDAWRSTLSPLGGDAGQWNPRPFETARVRIGLYALKYAQ